MSSFSFRDKDGWHTGYIHDGPMQIAQSYHGNGYAYHRKTWSELSFGEKFKYIICAPIYIVFHMMRLFAIVTAVIWLATGPIFGLHEIGFLSFMLGGLVMNSIKNLIFVITYKKGQFLW